MLDLNATTVSYSIPQTPQITNVVQRFWQVERHGAGFIRETIIPKGTVELIFNLQNSKIPGKIGTRDCVIPRCFISWFNTVPIQFQIADDQLFFGVFVKPIPIRKIFRIDTEEYANLCLDLTLVDKSIDTLWHQLNDQETFEQRVTVFTDWLVKRLPEISRHEQLFDDFLTGTPNRSTSAPELSRILCYSPRHLSRKLHELTAMNLEQTLMYKRYIQALDLVHHSQLLLTEIAHACNFSDQSHFTKTFRSYAQMKPSEYRTVKSQVSGHIFENVC